MLKDVLTHPIRDELHKMESIISQSLGKESYGHISEMMAYLTKSRGKRIRPILLLFSFKALVDGEKVPSIEVVNRQAVTLAAAIELIHMASLVHDDIIDHADTRHERASFHHKFGTEIGMTMGVFLYAKSLSLIAEVGHPNVLKVISDAVEDLCRGEITQLTHRTEPSFELDDYLRILKEKTGVLFAASCQCGAILAGASKPIQEALYQYGESLGIVFQIADDFMDVMGDQETLGKATGQDFEQGEITLPILYLIEGLYGEDRDDVIAKVCSKRPEHLAELKERIINSDAPDKSKALAKEYLNKAKLSLKDLPQTKFKKSLYSFVDFVEKRTFG
jgi:geranylgeranyl pyrophosphate synthase